MDKAQFLINQGYPTPYKTVEELALFMENRDKEKKSKEEYEKYLEWKKNNPPLVE